MKESLPALSKVLESIHAYLEKQLETQEEIAKDLKDIKELLKNEDKKGN